ncbi:MAG TPA: hypothetical protein VNL71_01830, partial [Chloroflexota bacterium]|nr:hypothetical protein [Chloroflexota bacterium]
MTAMSPSWPFVEPAERWERARGVELPALLAGAAARGPVIAIGERIWLVSGRVEVGSLLPGGALAEVTQERREPARGGRRAMRAALTPRAGWPDWSGVDRAAARLAERIAQEVGV